MDCSKIYILFHVFYSLISQIKSLVKFECDFEKDLCDFRINEFFVRYSGESPSISSGPSADRHQSKINLKIKNLITSITRKWFICSL